MARREKWANAKPAKKLYKNVFQNEPMESTVPLAGVAAERHVAKIIHTETKIEIPSHSENDKTGRATTQRLGPDFWVSGKQGTTKDNKNTGTPIDSRGNRSLNIRANYDGWNKHHNGQLGMKESDTRKRPKGITRRLKDPLQT